MTQPDPKLDNWTVLIVDDEEDNLFVASRMLEYFGAKVNTASSGKAGLEALKQNKPTFILLDLDMPEMDGWAVQKAIRSDPTIADTIVIALTANVVTATRAKATEAGFNGFIAKPFWLHNFIQDIKRVLRDAGVDNTAFAMAD